MEIELLWLAGEGRRLHIDLLNGVAGVVLTGGADVEPWRYGFEDVQGLCKTDPERDRSEWALLERLRKDPLPMLAICRGAQLLNVFYGGTLMADLGELNGTHRDRKAGLHPVEVSPGTRLATIVGAGVGKANSSHHQAVERLAEGFVVNARAEDGTVEGYEPLSGDGPFVLAVQWHPEAMTDGLPLADRVLDAFLQASASLSDLLGAPKCSP